MLNFLRNVNNKNLSPEEQLQKIKAGSADLVSEEELLSKLKKSVKNNKPLQIKAGFDPSRPDLHLGHLVLLNKLKIFQELGHQVVFLVGDFTALIGDPSGRNQTRPILQKEEVNKNAKTYTQQVFKILDKRKTKVVFNSQWMNKMSAWELIELAGRYSVSRMLEREDFSKRFKEQNSIGLHEFFYPLIQGYDSVVLKTDVELGAVDQLFNLLVGRALQKKMGQDPQCLITFPLLEGTDGVQKMSKSFHNYIALEDSPKEMFGKIMKLNDKIMLRYYKLLLAKTDQELQELKKQHPKQAKMNLGSYFVELFYGKALAEQTSKEFEKVFSQKQAPSDMKEYAADSGEIWLAYLLKNTGLAGSTSEARRLIQGGAVQWNGCKIQDEQLKLNLKRGEEHILQAGKRHFIKIKVEG